MNTILKINNQKIKYVRKYLSNVNDFQLDNDSNLKIKELLDLIEDNKTKYLFKEIHLDFYDKDGNKQASFDNFSRYFDFRLVLDEDVKMISIIEEKDAILVLNNETIIRYDKDKYTYNSLVDAYSHFYNTKRLIINGKEI